MTTPVESSKTDPDPTPNCDPVTQDISPVLPRASLPKMTVEKSPNKQEDQNKGKQYYSYHLKFDLPMKCAGISSDIILYAYSHMFTIIVNLFVAPMNLRIRRNVTSRSRMDVSMFGDR